MKKYLALAALAALTMAADRPLDHACVILSFDLTGTAQNGSYSYVGFKVQCASSSTNAPQFPQGGIPIPPTVVDPAQAIADCLNQGFHVQHVSDNGLTVMLVR